MSTAFAEVWFVAEGLLARVPRDGMRGSKYRLPDRPWQMKERCVAGQLQACWELSGLLGVSFSNCCSVHAVTAAKPLQMSSLAAGCFLFAKQFWWLLMIMSNLQVVLQAVPRGRRGERCTA